MQLTLYQHTKRPSENELQIIHCRSNHWIIVFSSTGCVDVYDSLFDEVDHATEKVIWIYLEMTGFTLTCKSKAAQMTVDCLP